MGEEQQAGVEGLEGGADEEVDGVADLNAVASVADVLETATDLTAQFAGMDTADLASAAAEMDVRAKRQEADLERRKARLGDVKKALAERMVTAGVSGVRVTTSDGRKLVHLQGVCAPRIVAGKKELVMRWLEAHHRELLFVGYNDAELRGKLAAWRKAQEGEFPQELVDAGAVQIYEGQEVRFRKSAEPKRG